MIGGIQSTILRALEAAGRDGLSTDELVDIAYRGCRRPLYPDAVVRGQIQRLRRNLVPSGATIVNTVGRVFASGRYRICALNEAAE